MWAAVISKYAFESPDVILHYNIFCTQITRGFGNKINELMFGKFYSLRIKTYYIVLTSMKVLNQ